MRCRGCQELPLLDRPGVLTPPHDPAIIVFVAYGPGEVSELADERDLGSRGAIRESSNLSFPIGRRLFDRAGATRAEVAQR